MLQAGNQLSSMANQLFLHKLKSYAEQIGTISKEEVLVLNAKKKNPAAGW